MNEQLRKELLEMEKKDQLARAYMKGSTKKIKKPNDCTWESIEETDFNNTQRLMEIVEEFDWPTISLVGRDGAKAAWLIVQHSSQEQEFQEYCLYRLEEAMLK